MLKKLNKKTIKMFTSKYEIKCSSITLEKIQEEYFLIINEVVRFKVSYNLIKQFI